MLVLSIIGRTFFAFVLLLILVRIVGKQQLSQMTFFDFTSGITIGSLAAIAAADLNLLWEPILAMTAWIVLTLAAANLALYSRKARKIIDGEPTILVRKGKILEHNLGKVRYTVDDLRGQLRAKGAFAVSDVEYAILETNGELSVLKNPMKEPPVRQDMLLVGETIGLETELIADGEIIYENLKNINKDEKWLREMLRAYGVEFASEVFYCSVDEKGKLFVDKYNDKLRRPRDPSDYKLDEWVNADLPRGKKHVAQKPPQGLSQRITKFEKDQVAHNYPHVAKVEQQIQQETKTVQDLKKEGALGEEDEVRDDPRS